MGRNGRPTASDVAAEAGVSRTTVGYVLNDTPHQKIPQGTRERVHQAAARLGYAPSAAARVLRSGRSNLVLGLLPDLPVGPNISSFLEHLSASLAEKGLTFLSHIGSRSDRPVSEIWSTVSPDAVLIMEKLSESDALMMKAAGIVTVTMLGDDPYGGDEQVGRRQVEHLAGRGHRRIGYAGTDDPRVALFAVPRLAGARAACAELGLPEPVVVTLSSDPAEAAGQVRSWRELDPPVSAVCCYNDDLALALLAAMRRLGLGAPADLAVIGVDDIPAAAYAAPPLTTVSIDPIATARYNSDAIIRALENKRPPRRPRAEIVDITVRESG